MFEQIALSLLIGNGDAHLKNFAILYENVNGPFQLSPVYDVVCTRPYGDETTALSINKSRNYPSRTYLEKMGKQFGVREPDKIIDRIGDAVCVVCKQYSKILAQLDALDVQTSIIKNSDLVLSR